MATVSGLAVTSNLPNFAGELFKVQPQDTPFKNLAAANGVRGVQHKEFTWQTTGNAAPSIPSVLEGADPVFEEEDRSEVSNVVQIFQYGVQISYSKLANFNMLGSGGATVTTPAVSVLDVQPVTNELELQQELKLDRFAEDYELACLTGTIANPSDNVTSRQTQGIVGAVTSNTVAAGTTDLSKDQLEDLFRQMYGSRARFIRPVIFGTAIQVQRINEIYGFAPESRTVGGINIERIITPFGEFGVVINRHITASTVLVADMAFVKSVVMPIPGKGELFLEPVAQTGAAVNAQLYGEWGLQYGPEQYHGTITGLTTS